MAGIMLVHQGAPDKDPLMPEPVYEKETYKDFWFKIATYKWAALLVVNRPFPSRYFSMYQPSAAEVKKYDLKDGVFFCYEDNGEVRMQKWKDSGDPTDPEEFFTEEDK